MKELLELLKRAEIELDAWKDARPDVAGETTQLLVDIREAIKKYDEPDLNGLPGN